MQSLCEVAVHCFSSVFGCDSSVMRMYAAYSLSALCMYVCMYVCICISVQPDCLLVCREKIKRLWAVL